MKSALKHLQNLSALESTPFNTKERCMYICKLCKKHKVLFEETDEYVLLKPTTTKGGGTKLIFVSHLDHPGIIVNKTGNGYVLGSVLENLNEKKSLVGVKLKSKNNQKQFTVVQQNQFKIKTGQKPSCANTILKLDISGYKSNKDFIKALALDNDAPTSVLLKLIPKFNELQKNYSVYFLFTKVEEIHQLSAYKFAKLNPIGINSKDFIFNLECKEITTNYGGEIVVHKAESFLDYGYMFNNSNLSTDLIRKNSRINISKTLGSTDARAFSNFKLTPNIATISIRNYAKHNIKNGKIVLEKIVTNSLIELENLIVSISKTTPKYSQKFEKKFFDKKAINNKIAIDERLLIAYKPWFKYGKVYPENIREKLEYSSYKYASYFTYYFIKLKNIL